VTRPPDEQPTTALPRQTVEQPSVTTGAETSRSSTWHSRIPARIGRARTSTVVIGALFVLLGGLNTLLPVRDTGTTPVTLENGLTVQVPNSALPSEARTTTTPPDPTGADPTDGVPATTSAQPTGTGAPSPTPDDEEPGTTTAPTSTPRGTSSTAPAPSSSSGATPTATATATTRAPATSAGTPSEEQVPEETGDPTG